MTDQHKLPAQRIKEARLKSKLSQEELAELAEVHASYIGQVERGEKNPSTSVLMRISKALEVPLSQLLESKDEIRPPRGGRAKWHQLAKLSESLDDEALEALLGLVRTLKRLGQRSGKGK